MLLVAMAVDGLCGCQREASPPSAVALPATATTPSAAPPAPVVQTPEAPPPAPVPPPIGAVEPLPEQAPPEQTAACLARSVATAAPRSVAVHRWVDADGITHYSDQVPPAGVKDHRVIDVRGLPPITVEAKGYDVDLPDQLQQRAVADALGVQRVMHDALGVAAPDGLTLHVVFVKAADAYARLIGDPALAESAGAYSTAQQTIFVRMQAQNEASFAVLRHEITHALVHESIGNLPTSINEGLAEYFGRYRVGGLGGQIDVGADRKAISAAAPDGDGSDALVDLLAREGRDFYVLAGDASGREQRYLRAYSLVAWLMRGTDGRVALSAALAAQRVDPCRPIASERVFETHFPGGLQAVSTGWVGFMRNPPDDIQAY
ncbi:MAG: DUF4124 domain-containing protein [Dokdonella sp.]